MADFFLKTRFFAGNKVVFAKISTAPWSISIPVPMGQIQYLMDGPLQEFTVLTVYVNVYTSIVPTEIEKS